jgi:hypothetical protein
MHNKMGRMGRTLEGNLLLAMRSHKRVLLETAPLRPVLWLLNGLEPRTGDSDAPCPRPPEQLHRHLSTAEGPEPALQVPAEATKFRIWTRYRTSPRPGTRSEG